MTNLKIVALRWACRIGGGSFASWFILVTSDWTDYRAGRPTVVALYRPLFSKDLVELRKRTNLNWVYINNEYLAHVQTAWTPREIQEQTFYQRYREARYAGAWRKLGEFGDAVVRRLRKRAEISAFLTSHIDYWHAEGVRVGARRAGIPFLGLCREHMCLPIEQRSVTEYYKGFVFEGDAIAVFGESTREIFIRSGACTPEQVVVTGPPRLDVWRDISKQKKGPADHIVLLSYRDPDYRAPQSFREVLGLFLECAARHREKSDVVFLVKAKNLEDAEEIRGLVGKRGSNLVIDHLVQLPDLFPRSRLIIGFNSLSVLEAHFTEAAIVVPYWGDARRDPDELIFNPNDPVTRQVINFAESPREMAGLIDETAEHLDSARGTAAERLAVIRTVFHFPTDWTCSDCVEEFIQSRLRTAGSPDSGLSVEGGTGSAFDQQFGEQG